MVTRLQLLPFYTQLLSPSTEKSREKGSHIASLLCSKASKVSTSLYQTLQSPTRLRVLAHGYLSAFLSLPSLLSGPIHTGSLLFLERATACSHPGLLPCFCQELPPLPHDSWDSSGSLYKCHLSSETFPYHRVENKTTRPQLSNPGLTVFSPQPFSLSCVLFTAYLFGACLSLLSSVWMGTGDLDSLPSP